ncbi:MAG: glycosyltransferase family 2 protein [Paracoccaceae bacterium]
MQSMRPTSVTPADSPSVSVVLPLRNEQHAIAALVEEIVRVLSDMPFEILLVDDGSTDRTRETCLSLAAADARIRVLCHDTSAGQSAALHSGVLAAAAPIIATMDGDGQNPPENLPRLIAPLIDPDAPTRPALVAGQRVGRKDTWSKRMASRLANSIRAAVLRDGTRDTGCGLKAFRRDAFLALPYFNHMHRYLPALFARDGLTVALVDVTHAPRLYGTSNYGNLDRALVGIVDLAGVAWLIHRRKKAQPMLLTVSPGVAPSPARSSDAQAPETLRGVG